MHGLSIKTYSTIDEYYFKPSPPKPQSRPLRSHSVEKPSNPQVNIHRYQSDRPDSFILNDSNLATHQRYWHELPPFSQQRNLRSGGSAERFSYSTNASASTTDFAIVPVRPPLRPTGSFGDGSALSYYSSASAELERKSYAIALEEEAGRRKAKLPSAQWLSRLLRSSGRKRSGKE